MSIYLVELFMIDSKLNSALDLKQMVILSVGGDHLDNSTVGERETDRELNSRLLCC